MFTGRTHKLLICVCARHATAAYWRSGRIAHMERFANSEQGFADFRAFLAPHADTPVFVVADTVEEDYRLEMLPHCFGAERRQVVARRLKQHYRNTPYVGAWLQARDGGKRRDDRYLFSALTNADLIDEWLRVVHAQELPLAGVYLLPMISAGLLDRIHARTANLLIATRHTEGLRLTFFRNRHFRSSRLTHGDASKNADLARLFLTEISNTRLYLHALRSVAIDEPLTVLLLDPDDELEPIAAAIVQDNPALTCIRAGRAEICLKLGISAAHLAPGPEALYLQLLGLHGKAGNIAPAVATRRYGRYRAQRALYASCAAIAAASTFVSVMNGWSAYGIRARADEVAARVSTEDLRYQEITKQFVPAPVSGEAMKRAIEVSQALRENARDPLPMMAAISRALESSPDIVLREFGWTYAAAEIQKGQDAASPSDPTPAGAASSGRKQSAYVQGEIRYFRGDYRAAIGSIEALAARLRRDPSVAEVRATKMPLNVSPSAILSGNTLHSRGEPATAEFELLIVYKHRA
jgi:hypothetical protein